MTTAPVSDWLAAALESLRAGDVDGFLKMCDDDAVHEILLVRPVRPNQPAMSVLPQLAERAPQLTLVPAASPVMGS